MQQAQSGDRVRVHYTGTLADGSEFDSSRGRDPLEFTLGGNQIIPGFDQAVTGMAIGESKKVTIDSNEAYGPRRDELVAQVERSQIPDEIALEIGNRVQASGPNDQVIDLTIVEVGEETVTLDANHPLAGKELIFEIELVEIV